MDSRNGTDRGSRMADGCADLRSPSGSLHRVPYRPPPSIFRVAVRARVILMFLVGLFAAGNAIAAESADEGLQWRALTEEQQQVLARFETRWERLPPARQRALVERAQRWASMSPEDREAARKRLERWKSMDPERRRELRRRYEAFKSLPPEEQARIRKHFRRFKSLPPEKRRELREKFHRLSPEERQAVLEKLKHEH